ncbi:MAG: CcmD family protein [Terriglobia bacterium]|jgi:CcmD family protein
MVNGYLFAAYSFVWAIFVVYVWILARRQAQLRNELADLKRKIQEASLSASASRRS